jgi:hypothetical protein
MPKWDKSHVEQAFLVMGLFPVFHLPCVSACTFATFYILDATQARLHLVVRERYPIVTRVYMEEWKNGSLKRASTFVIFEIE